MSAHHLSTESSENNNPLVSEDSVTALPIEEDFVDIEGDSPLLKSLERQGKFSQTVSAQQMVARNRFVTRGWSKAASARAVGVAVSTLERWATIFGWEEERNQKMFHQWQKVAGVKEKLTPNVEERADRIFGGIESVIEDVLHKHMDGEADLAPKDITALASAMKTSHDARRVIHKVKNPDNEKTIKFEGDVGIVHQIGEMLADAVAPPQLGRESKIQVEIGDVEDAEFELVPEPPEDGFDS